MLLEQRMELVKAACNIALAEDLVGESMLSAIAAADRGDFDTAIDTARTIVRTNPRYSDAAVLLAVLLRGRSQHDQANGLLKQAISQEPNNASVFCYLALEEMVSGNSQLAVALLEAGANCQPSDSFVLFTLAWLLHTLGRERTSEQEQLVSTLTEWLCPAAMGLLPVSSQQPDTTLARTDTRKSLHCFLNLAHLWHTSRANTSSSPTATWSTVCRTADLSVLGDGMICHHLNNPALASYRSHFGEHVVTQYADTFFEMILGPSIESKLPGHVLSQVLKSQKPTELPEEMVYVPAAQFKIGASNAPCNHQEQKVTVRGYLIDRLPVTNSQWREFRPNHRIPQGAENHPIVSVDFIQATMYARWRGKRLPTEVEWEAAARGVDGRQFPWGNQVEPKNANCIDNNLNGLAFVDQHPGGISPCGAVDMVGNAREWVDTLGPIGKGQTPTQVVKGGAFTDTCASLTCWNRVLLEPTTKAQVLGFRCAKTS